MIFISSLLYDNVSSKNDLRLTGAVRYFRLGAESDDICVVFKDDYKNHVTRVANGNEVAGKIFSYSDFNSEVGTLLTIFCC